MVQPFVKFFYVFIFLSTFFAFNTCQLYSLDGTWFRSTTSNKFIMANIRPSDQCNFHDCRELCKKSDKNLLPYCAINRNFCACLTQTNFVPKNYNQVQTCKGDLCADECSQQGAMQVGICSNEFFHNFCFCFEPKNVPPHMMLRSWHSILNNEILYNNITLIGNWN